MGIVFMIPSDNWDWGANMLLWLALGDDSYLWIFAIKRKTVYKNIFFWYDKKKYWQSSPISDIF